jgi:hypothetical protein
VSDAVAAAKPRIETHKAEPVTWKDKTDQLWKGWLLPRSEEDIWFVAGSAEYYRVLQSPDVDGAMTTSSYLMNEAFTGISEISSITTTTLHTAPPFYVSDKSRTA